MEFDAEDLDLDAEMEVEMDGRDDLFMLDDPSAYGLDTGAAGLAGDAGLARAGGGVALLEREAAGAVVRVEYKIEEAAFHCIAMAACDLFVRRGGDAGETDVFDFSEVYFAPPGSDVYSIPCKLAPMPLQAVRCQVGRWTYITGKILPHSNDPYKPSAKEIDEVTKVFFIRHVGDARTARGSLCWTLRRSTCSTAITRRSHVLTSFWMYLRTSCGTEEMRHSLSGMRAPRSESSPRRGSAVRMT
ncbi:hypothetical protein CLOM_g17523 [Closterium sp. NIES-68]|nr:hypothetical protein CLOM_g17523 [Closterium sp. NIES-68]